jgi:hypothetical protein
MDTHITIDGNAITGDLPLCEAGDGSVGQNVLAYQRLSTTTGNRTVVSSLIMCTLKGLRPGNNNRYNKLATRLGDRLCKSSW